MKLDSFRVNFFTAPFLSKRFFCLTIACLALIALRQFAAAQSVQMPAEDFRRLVKSAEKETKKGNLAEAEKFLRRAAELNPRSSAVNLDLAHTLIKLRRLTEGYAIALEIAKTEPKNSYAYAVLGAALVNSGNFKEARLSLYHAIYTNKKESLAWAQLGMLDFYENKIADSLKSLREAIYYDDDEPDYVYTYAQVSARAEDYLESANAYRRFLMISGVEDKDRRARIEGLIGFLNFLGTRSQLYALSGNPQTSVAFDLVSNRPIIEVKVNGADKPLRFVLDTGSGISVISDKTAKKLKIGEVARGGKARGIGGEGKFDIVYGFLRSVEVGAVKIKNVPVYIRKFHQSAEAVDGYIGLSLISKFLTTVDYGARTFVLTRKDSVQNAALAEELPSLPLRLTTSGFLSGEVRLEGVESPLNFIVDTGASVSVISNNLADVQKTRQFAEGEKMRVIGAAGITENVQSFLLPRLSFGDHWRDSVTAIMLDLDLINETSGFEQAGILGGNFLKNYRLTFDFENSKVIFVPISK